MKFFSSKTENKIVVSLGTKSDINFEKPSTIIILKTHFEVEIQSYLSYKVMVKGIYPHFLLKCENVCVDLGQDRGYLWVIKQLCPECNVTNWYILQECPGQPANHQHRPPAVNNSRHILTDVNFVYRNKILPHFELGK